MEAARSTAELARAMPSVREFRERAIANGYSPVPVRTVIEAARRQELAERSKPPNGF